MAEGSDKPTWVAQPKPAAHWYQGLGLRLFALGLAAWLLFSVGIALLQDPVGADSAAQDRDNLQRVAGQFGLLVQSTQTLATQLAQLAAGNDGLNALRNSVPSLIQQQLNTRVIAAVGVWPLPNTLDPARERASLVWMRQDDGDLTVREDYNDPRTASYVQEKWLTPARYSPGTRCHWSAAYTDPLSKRSVITCAAPIRNAQGTIGTISVSLDARAVAQLLASAATLRGGMALVTTLAGDVVATTDNVGEHSPHNLADLARDDSTLNPIALGIHQHFESVVQAVAPAADMVAALKRESRDLSQDEAVSALVGLALTAPSGALQPQVRSTTIGGAWRGATVTQLSVPGQWWTALLISPATVGIPGFARFSKEAILASLAMLGFTVLLLWALRLWVLQPLREITAQIAAATNTRDTQHPVTENYGAELALLAHWHNESQRQLVQMQTLQARQAPIISASDRVEGRTNDDSLQRTRERAQSALRAVRDGIIIFNEQGRVEELNLAAEKLLALSTQTAAGKPFGEVLRIRPSGEVKAAIPELADLVLRLKAPLELPQTVLLTDANGHVQPIRAGFHPVLTRQGNAAGCIATLSRAEGAASVAKPEAAQRTLDSMTGLPMRNSCETDLRQLLNEPAPLPLHHAILLIDADNLKRINDAQGQRAGDQVIVQIAGVLNNIANKEGYTAYRLYGDQFAILAKNTTEEQTGTFAEALCSRFSGAPLRGKGDNDSYRITVSVGTCLLDSGSSDPAELIRRCELACSAAKKLGGNRSERWTPSAAEHRRQVDESLWLKRIRAGLERDMFHLTTQALAPTQPDAPIGFQVLLALEDEEGFWSPASAFLPTAQRHDLTGELDRWLIRHTVQHLRSNPALLDKIGFAFVHLSDSAPADNDLLESLVKLFANNTNLPAAKFCFVLTEHALHQHPHNGAVFCEVLRNLGCKICVDGFVGRRTSDIAHFRKLSLDFIRIDTSNFPNIDTDSIERMLTESLISVARALCKHIIVSEIATPAKQQVWKTLGADYLQGEAVAKASPVLFS